jgi:short-subunit dehydrogenase
MITGASAGIGAEFARIFATNGHDLVCRAARDRLYALRDELASTGATITVIAKNLALRTAAKSLYKEVNDRGIRVDILVNNAGVAYGGAFTGMDPEAVSHMVVLNAATLASLTRLFVTDMVTRGAGRILNVASLSAFQAAPIMSLYAATKAFVLSFTEGLAEELRGTGVTATRCARFNRNRYGPGDRQRPSGNTDSAERRQRRRETRFRCACMAAVVRVPGVANQLSALWSQTQPRWLVRTLAE